MSKVILVGAGSHFTLPLLGDFLRVGLSDIELTLMDIDEKRLKFIENVVLSTVKRYKIDVRVTSTTDLREALENANFVICSIRVGGIRAQVLQLEVPLRYGIIHTVGDTTGPSGVLKALLEIPAIMEIAYAMEDICPKATLLNFSNPMTPICMAIANYTKVNVIGLCHGVFHMVSLASKLLEMSEKSIEVIAAGINHLTWTLDIRRDNTSIYREVIKELFNEDKEQVIRDHPYIIGREIYSIFKALPTLNDRHTAEFFPYLNSWLREKEVMRILNKGSLIDLVERKVKETVLKRSEYLRERLMKMKEGLIPLKPSKEYAIDIINCVISSKFKFLLAANLKNEGYVSNLPDYAVVEVPAIATPWGVRGVGIGKLPEWPSLVLKQHLIKFKTLVEGIIERDKDLIVQAIALDPLVNSIKVAKLILSDFLKACKELKLNTSLN